MDFRGAAPSESNADMISVNFTWQIFCGAGWAQKCWRLIAAYSQVIHKQAATSIGLPGEVIQAG